MKKKNLLIPFSLILILVLLLFAYFSPLNSKSITEISADNIDELSKVPFNIRIFDLDRDRFNENNYIRSNQKLFEDFTGYPAGSKIRRENYLDEYIVDYQDVSEFYVRDGQTKYSFSQSFGSTKLYIRLDGLYRNSDDKNPITVHLASFHMYQWYTKYFPKEQSIYGAKYYIKRYDEEYYNKYLSETLESFKQIGYIQKATNLKDGYDILINNNIDPNVYLTIKTNGERLIFGVYSKRKIYIPFLEYLF